MSQRFQGSRATGSPEGSSSSSSILAQAGALGSFSSIWLPVGMGAGASSSGAPPGSPGANIARLPDHADAECPEYLVRHSKVSELACPDEFYLRLEPEAVVFAHAGDGPNREAFQHFPYYVIMCWGHSRVSFQFRLFRQGSQVKTIVVSTKHGKQIETEIMVVVRRLMAKMHKHGTSKQEFAAFVEVLSELASEEDSAETVSKVLQFCQAHALTISQAKSIMKRAYAPDAFDRIEIASAIKTSLINPDSFQMVLHTFDNVDDRLNLCHRLNLPEEMAYSETVALNDAPTPVPPPKKTLRPSSDNGEDARKTSDENEESARSREEASDLDKTPADEVEGDSGTKEPAASEEMEKEGGSEEVT